MSVISRICDNCENELTENDRPSLERTITFGGEQVLVKIAIVSPSSRDFCSACALLAAQAGAALL